ncbi:MAG: flippase [Flavobacteriales bacterium]|nr:flippase [Flavobacteriales bacterium]
MNKIKSYLSKYSRDVHFFELIKGASSTFLLKIVGLLVGYGLAIFITNKFGAFVFGQYVTALLIVEILSIISRLGIDTVLVRFISRYVHKGASSLINQLFFKSIALVTLSAVVFTLLLLFFSDYIANFMNLDEEYLLIVSFSFIPLVLFHMNTQAIRGLKQMMSFSFLNNVAITLFTFILMVVLVAFSTSEKLPIYAYVMSVFVMTISSYFLWFFHRAKIVDSKQNNSESELSTKALFKVSIPLLLGQSMMLIMGKVDLFMLANMTSSDKVGIYNIALKLSMLAYMGLMAVNSIAAPKFSEIHSSGDIDALKKIVQQSTKTIFWVTFPVILLFLIFPDTILGVFGDEFKLAAMALIILSISKMFSAISGSVGTFLQMVGKQNVFQNILIFTAIINIVLNYTLIPKYGIDGAAFASAISGVIWNVLMIIYIKKNFGFYSIYFPGIKR